MRSYEETIVMQEKISEWIITHPHATPGELADYCATLDKEDN